MTVGERGPTGDHGQMGDQGKTGVPGKRGFDGPEGHEGAPGERGQSGDQGKVGPKGEKGEKGERYSSWLTRNVVKGYAILLVGVLASIALTAYAAERNAERAREAMIRFESEAIATDRSFCALANQSRGEINRNREATRALESAVRQSFQLVVPEPDATPLRREQINAFRMKILALLDQVRLDGNLELLDCSGIGNGRLDFSMQDAVTEATTTTSRRAP